MREVEIYLNVSLGYAFMRYDEGNEMRLAWKGHLDLPDDDDQATAIVWAYFQNPLGQMVESRQDQEWINRSQELTKGYEDRSLSAGDVVTLDGNDSYAVEWIGWKPVPLLTGQSIEGPEGDQKLRDQSDAVNEGRCPCCGGPIEGGGVKFACENEKLCGWSMDLSKGIPEVPFHDD